MKDLFVNGYIPVNIHEYIDDSKLWKCGDPKTLYLIKARKKYSHKLDMENKPPCMSDQDYKDWRLFSFLRNPDHETLRACEDCTCEYMEKMKAQGKCIK